MKVSLHLYNDNISLLEIYLARWPVTRHPLSQSEYD